MSPSSAASSSMHSVHSVFEHPRSAPLPHPPLPSSASSRSTPEGFIIPVVPSSDDPLVISYDSRGHRVLPNVSNTPLDVLDGRVTKLVQEHPMVIPKCANCAEQGITCSYYEAGVPCPPCSVLGIPECDWADPFWVLENFRRSRDSYFCDERDALVKSVKENRLPVSLFEREFEIRMSWFYSGAQGAINRYLLNSRATRDVGLRGYKALAASTSDASTLLRFITLGVETRVHPCVLQVITERVQDLLASMLS
ncbi:hypothetical protein DFH07DRAFT_943930 [Mycena maculata]|uniref:Uncharacterized protein n=1 Tax=Mycena maculata TaxID=230809 RepID=A0AAD7IDI2_9AGAR|nr:hypothetical protein DFH07DRAFT_1064403 [Mycena maculata]KAJ7739444.1 hypothetical protein DFH07DRAFT_943930 [Mycena maculata]